MNPRQALRKRTSSTDLHPSRESGVAYRRMESVKVAKAVEAFANKPPVIKAKEAFWRSIKREEPTVQDKLATFFNETSFTPLVRIYNATNWCKRISWLVVVLGMLAWLTVQCYWLFDRYLKYPVEVKMDFVSARELDFPSVTVCNLNPLRRSEMHDIPFKELIPFIDVKFSDMLYDQFQSDYMGRFTTGYDDERPPPPTPPAIDIANTQDSGTTDAAQPLPTSSATDASNTEETGTTNAEQPLPTSSATDASNTQDSGTTNAGQPPPTSSATDASNTQDSGTTNAGQPLPTSSATDASNTQDSGTTDAAQPLPTSSATDASNTQDSGTTNAGQPPPTTQSTTEDTIPDTTEAETTTAEKKRRRKRSADTDWEEVGKTNTFNKWDMLEDESVSMKFYEKTDADYNAVLAFASFSKRYPADVVMHGGHGISNFIVSCKMAGFMCSPKNFTKFLNHKYGNCFTFNGPENVANVTTRYAGPIHGLTLEMYIQQDEYIGSLSPAAGVRVLIHPRNTMPFPEDEGISISPGYETSIGIRKMDIHRLPAPHGSCASEGVEPDLYVQYENTTYSKLSCLKSCYQRLSLLYCGCAVPYFYVVQNSTVCTMTDTETEHCVKYLPNKYPEAFLQCDQDCPLPCSEVKFRKTLSSAQWPSNQYGRTMTEKVQQSNYLFMGSYIDTGKEFAKLEVYYQDLMFEKLEQQKAYESPNLISDVGGQLGLWLGLSAITIGELCSFILSIVKALVLNRRKKTPVEPFDNVHLKTYNP